MGNRQNCWDFKNCSFGPDGNGLCPAAKQGKLDGIHDGLQGGRVCWVFSGTFCGGLLQGDFVNKYTTCMNCEFYQMVMEEEGPKFQLTLLLMKRLKAA